MTTTLCGRSLKVGLGSLLAGALLGCATAKAPKELVDARSAYGEANQGPSAKYTPAQLLRAKEALDAAEGSFKSNPDSIETRDLAYLALRKAQLANVQGNIGMQEEKLRRANSELQQNTALALSSARKQLTEAEKAARERAIRDQYESEKRAKTNEDLARTSQQLEAEKQARAAAEAEVQKAKEQAAQMKTKLEDIAKVREEARGTVITLSGSVLFASNKSTLLPAAQLKLNEVAEALKESKRNFIIEGHTDSKGSDGHNQELSARRAEAVRDYLASRGVPADKIRTAGMGESQPVADNATAEGRANNRRVEIIVERPANAPATTGTGGSGGETQTPTETK